MRTAARVRNLLLTFLFGVSVTFAAETPPTWWGPAANEAQREGYDLITPDELRGWYRAGRDFLVVDARPAYEYAAGHLPQALNLEFDLGDRLALPAQKRAALANLLGADLQRSIVMYCRSFR